MTCMKQSSKWESSANIGRDVERVVFANPFPFDAATSGTAVSEMVLKQWRESVGVSVESTWLFPHGVGLAVGLALRLLGISPYSPRDCVVGIVSIRFFWAIMRRRREDCPLTRFFRSWIERVRPQPPESAYCEMKVSGKEDWCSIEFRRDKEGFSSTIVHEEQRGIYAHTFFYRIPANTQMASRIIGWASRSRCLQTTSGSNFGEFSGGAGAVNKGETRP